MDMETIIQFINGVGFPIAVSIILFYQNEKQDERYKETINDLSKVIENNTLTVNELNVRLANREGGEKIG